VRIGKSRRGCCRVQDGRSPFKDIRQEGSQVDAAKNLNPCNTGYRLERGQMLQTCHAAREFVTCLEAPLSGKIGAVKSAMFSRMLMKGRWLQPVVFFSLLTLCRAADPDEKTSKPALEKADAETQFSLGKSYLKGTNYAAAAEAFRKAAEQGHAFAQNNLGVLYSKGLGVTQSYVEAAKWYRKDAEKGDALAQNSLGWFLVHSRGMDQDYKQAAVWYRKAAEQDLPEAQNHLGDLYYEGLGVERDYAEALKWITKAADHGRTSAMNTMGVIYELGLGVPQDYGIALKWFQQAADQRDGKGQFNIGRLYDRGIGVSPDYVKAYQWYTLAVNQGQDGAAKSRLELSLKMTPDQIAEGERLAKELSSSQRAANVSR
jgi:TPR repeat protein